MEGVVYYLAAVPILLMMVYNLYIIHRTAVVVYLVPGTIYIYRRLVNTEHYKHKYSNPGLHSSLFVNFLLFNIIIILRRTGKTKACQRG